MDEITILKTIQEFLIRSDLKGREAPAFNQCMVYIENKKQDLLNPKKGTAEEKKQNKE